MLKPLSFAPASVSIHFSGGSPIRITPYFISREHFDDKGRVIVLLKEIAPPRRSTFVTFELQYEHETIVLSETKFWCAGNSFEEAAKLGEFPNLSDLRDEVSGLKYTAYLAEMLLAISLFLKVHVPSSKLWTDN